MLFVCLFVLLLNLLSLLKNFSSCSKFDPTLQKLRGFLGSFSPSNGGLSKNVKCQVLMQVCNVLRLLVGFFFVQLWKYDQTEMWANKFRIHYSVPMLQLCFLPSSVCSLIMSGTDDKNHFCVYFCCLVRHYIVFLESPSASFWRLSEFWRCVQLHMSNIKPNTCRFEMKTKKIKQSAISYQDLSDIVWLFFFFFYLTFKSICQQASHVTSVSHHIHSRAVPLSCTMGPSRELITFIKVLSQAV